MNAAPNVGTPNVSTLSPVSLTNIEVGKYYVIKNQGLWQIVKVTGMDRAANGSSTLTGYIRVLFISSYLEWFDSWESFDDIVEGAFPKSRIGESIKFYKKQEGGRRRKGTRRSRRVIAQKTRRSAKK